MTEPSDQSDWKAILDLYEAGLTHHQSLVDGEISEETNPWPPSALPTTPLPEELRTRAERLHRQSHGLIDDMAGALAALPPRRHARPVYRGTPDQPRWTLTL